MPDPVAISIQRSAVTGAAYTMAAASADGNTIANNGRILLFVKNGGSGASVVTIDSKAACNQGFDHDGGGSVAAGATKVFGPFPTARFNDSNTGLVSISFDQVVDVEVAAVEMA